MKIVFKFFTIIFFSTQNIEILIDFTKIKRVFLGFKILYEPIISLYIFGGFRFAYLAAEGLQKLEMEVEFLYRLYYCLNL